MKTYEAMYGNTYTATVQAINKNGKISLLSEPAVFVVKNQTKAKTPPKVEQTVIPDASPIIGLYSSVA